ncbi:hypothetical protein, partial [Staphylococcus aureus]|uniref:hypothetical protein n=1 Tax=Staphylococcus aureus TaxID=1280 RepID=UPI0012B11598|nr:hypothetical protein [Staphylococcus aureus]
MLTLQTDWLVGPIVALTAQKQTVASVTSKSSSVDGENKGERTAFFADTSGKKSQSDSVFNASGFIKDDNTSPR